MREGKGGRGEFCIITKSLGDLSTEGTDRRAAPIVTHGTSQDAL